jgi:hypothetical protein
VVGGLVSVLWLVLFVLGVVVAVLSYLTMHVL